MAPPDELAKFRDRMYRNYATDHRGVQNAEVEAVGVRAQVLPLLPDRKGSRIVDIGCGQGTIVRTLRDLGYPNTEGVDISPEQVALAVADGIEGITCADNLTFLNDNAGQLDVVLATDVLEHCTKTEVLDLFDAVHVALRPGGLFIARVPNAGSPFSGRIQHGDFTHETSFTVWSLSQIANVTGFESATFTDPAPVPHGLKSAIRWALWRVIRPVIKVALIVETGMLRGHYVSQTVIMRAVR